MQQRLVKAIVNTLDAHQNKLSDHSGISMRFDAQQGVAPEPRERVLYAFISILRAAR